MEYVAVTLKGIEDVCASELNGKVLTDKRVLFKKLKPSRTSARIYQLLKKFQFETLDDIINTIPKIKFQIPKNKTFRVTCNREGSHNFKSVDVEMQAGQLLKKQHPNVNLKTPDIIIQFDVINNNCFIGKLIQDNMCKRPYRVKINNQSINACLASALIKLAEAKPNETILDPFCKDAIIPIEARLMGIKSIFAIDENKNNIRNAIINAKMAKANIKIHSYSIDWLDTIFKKKSIDKIITNLFITRFHQEPEKTIKEFFHQSSHIVKSSITLITNKPQLIKEKCQNDFSLTHEREIKIGDMVLTILIFKKTNLPT